VRSSRLFLLIAILWAGATARFGALVSADEWLPITPEESKMTGDPKAPGAPAIILYRQIDRDDSDSREHNYVRTKIFTEEGRKYADVEIPFLKGREKIRNIKARTVRPDGSIADFDGKVYEKEIVKARGFKVLAKTFTLSDVQAGSIIEYQYMVEFDSDYVFNSQWVLSHDLFTKHAKFSLKTYPWPVQWSWPNNLPDGVKPPSEDGKYIRMDAQDIPAFQAEDDMPPENALKYVVDFVYNARGFDKDAEEFWKKQDRFWYFGEEEFVNKRKAMEGAVAQIVSPGDSPEEKLQKIYAKTQGIRNTTYQIGKTEQEQKRAKEKDINNVEDIWKRGYGDEFQVNWLFLALARAAGFDAYALRTSRRDDRFFKKSLMNAGDVGTNAVLVKLNGKDLFLEPGVPHAPLGMMPWSQTGVAALKLDKDGGTWLTTPIPDSSASQVVRKADLTLDSEGNLSGKLAVTFTGLEALWRRVDEQNEDEPHRKGMLENYVKEIVPVGIEVALTNKPDWDSSSPSFVAGYSLKVPGWVSGAGRRVLLPVGLFSATEKHVYEHATRVHPLYFHYMSQRMDDVQIELPLGWQVTSVPQPVTQDAKLLIYKSRAENKNGRLHLERSLRVDLVSLEQKYYPALRNFYQLVKNADEQQIVLQPQGVSSGN